MGSKKEVIRSRYNQTASHYDPRYRDIQFQKFSAFSEVITSSTPYIVDVGGGSGLLCDFTSQECVLMDISINMLKRGIAYENCISAVACDAENIPIRKKACEMVASFSVLQNLTDLLKGIQELLRINVSNLIITVLAKTISKELFTSKLKVMSNIKFEEVLIDIEDFGFVIKH